MSAEMTVEQFKESPWSSSHVAYESSFIHLKPAPENATGEVVLASLYRRIGFGNCPESIVPKNGQVLAKGADEAKRPARDNALDANGSIPPVAWAFLLNALQSPRQPNQSKRAFLQLCPLVPDVALYSSAARLVGSPWRPGELVARLVRAGSPSAEAAENLWKDLFDGLAITNADDVWARWLSAEFSRHRPKEVTNTWELQTLGADVDGRALDPQDYAGMVLPAKRFVRDLRWILNLKGRLTRRQWISLLESLLRLGTTAHVLWHCRVNQNIWTAIRRVLDGEAAPSTELLRSDLLSVTKSFWRYGKPAVAGIQDLARSYIGARAGINLVLWTCNQLPSFDCKSPLSSAADVSGFLAWLGVHRAEVGRESILEAHAKLLEREPRLAACKAGITSNLVEFIRYTLGQRQTADESLRGYDQGYALKRKGKWVVELGPIATMVAVTCCIQGSPAPRTVRDLCFALGEYGIAVEQQDIEAGDLGRTLRTLGLVLDSPDAEGGMVLVDPFKNDDGGV